MKSPMLKYVEDDLTRVSANELTQNEMSLGNDKENQPPRESFDLEDLVDLEGGDIASKRAKLDG
jgi:hypothetical protein